MLSGLTTARVLLDRALEVPCGQPCVEWAVGMLLRGHDSKHLAMLASMSPPHNHFELRQLENRALEELDIEDIPLENGSRSICHGATRSVASER